MKKEFSGGVSFRVGGGLGRLTLETHCSRGNKVKVARGCASWEFVRHEGKVSSDSLAPKSCSLRHHESE